MVKHILVILMALSATIASAETWLDHSFESDTTGMYPSYTDGSSGAGFSGDDLNRVVEANGVTPRTGSKMLQLKFGTGAGSATQNFTLGSNQTGDVYIRFYIYYPDGTETGENEYVHAIDGNNKLLRLYGDAYDNDIKVGASSNHLSGDYVEWLYIEAGYVDSTTYDHACAGGMTGFTIDGVRQDQYELYNIDLGRWISYEFHFRADSGAGDGVMQFWVDGVLVQSGAGLSWLGAPCDPGYFLNGYLLGAANSGFAVETNIYVDDVVFSDEYIGLDGANITCYPDVDGDLYPGSGSESVETCSTNYYESSHFIAMTEDCIDTNAEVNPGEAEVCGNGLDDDCVGGDQVCAASVFSAADGSVWVDSEGNFY